MKTTSEQPTTTIEAILDRLFTNGAGEKADRLLLIQESASGDAKISNAAYLGGYSREAVRRILERAVSDVR